MGLASASITIHHESAAPSSASSGSCPISVRGSQDRTGADGYIYRTLAWERSDPLGYYFPYFVWKFFLTNIGPRCNKNHHVHVYDFASETLHETHRIPQSGTVFEGFYSPCWSDKILRSLGSGSLVQGLSSASTSWQKTNDLSPGGHDAREDNGGAGDVEEGEDEIETLRGNLAVRRAEEAFYKLEREVEKALAGILRELAGRVPNSNNSSQEVDAEGRVGGRGGTSPQEKRRNCRLTASLPASSHHALIKYLLFLRFRNGDAYRESVQRFRKGEGSRGREEKTKREMLVRDFETFLRHEYPLGDGYQLGPKADAGNAQVKFKHQCWLPLLESRVEITLGVSSEVQEFVTTERWFGNLDEAVNSDAMAVDGRSDPLCNLFFPVTPSVTMYLIEEDPPPPFIPPIPLSDPFSSNNVGEKRKREEYVENFGEPGSAHKRSRTEESPVAPPNAHARDTPVATTTIECDIESVPDVHIRNTVLLLQSTSLYPDSHSHTHAPPDSQYILFSSLASLVTATTATVNNLTTPTLGSIPSSSPQYRSELSRAQVLALTKLRSMCRERHIREGLKKTLLVKHVVPISSAAGVSDSSVSGDHQASTQTQGEQRAESVDENLQEALHTLAADQHRRSEKVVEMPVPDLTNEVKMLGDCAFEHGSFADIWKGVWAERVNVVGLSAGVDRAVAIKVIRQLVVAQCKEKLLKRLKAEVLTWHRLRHPHISPMYGIVQMPHHLAMVSPWCNNGTVVHYLKEVNPDADKVKLMLQIASGVAYLHNYKPVVIHGDLKGNNILIDDKGNALVTDFGVSKVIEDFASSSPTSAGSDSSRSLAASFFGGATRWMAPELVMALVDDEEDGKMKTPVLTRCSDVYAFAAVCFEIVTGQLPYPNRTNSHAVTYDKLRGLKPSNGGVPTHVVGTAFWDMMDRCWDRDWYLRPDMSELTVFFQSLCVDGTVASS